MKRNVLRKEKHPGQESKSILQLTRKQFFLWFGITFLSMAWMFVLGIFVGRGLSPVRFDVPKIKGDMATLKKKVLPTERAAPAEAVPDPEDSELGFYRALREKHMEPEAVVASKAPEKPAVSKTRPADRQELPVAPAVKEPAAAVISEKRDIPVAEPEAPEATAEKSVISVPDKLGPEPVHKEPVYRFSVQVAAFKNVDRARELIVYLRRKGYDAYQATASLPDKGTYHRVRVGRFTSREEALATVSRLGKNNLEAVVVRQP